MFPHLRWFVVAWLLTAGAASGQEYFGQNKVQYETFDFKVLHTDHFDVYFYEAERQAAAQAARMAERWYARYSRVLDHQLQGRQPLILYANHADFEQTNVVGGQLGQGTGGVTEMFKRRIVLPLGSSLAETDHVIGHELVHAFQYDIEERMRRSSGGGGGMQGMPLWLVEGMAEYLSIGPVDAHTAMWMREAALRGELPKIKDLNDPKYFPYRWGQAFWAYVAGLGGDQVVAQLFKLAAASGDIDQALQRVLGASADELSKRWQAALQQRTQEVKPHTQPASAIARPLVRGKSELQALNVSPAVSPDGRWLMFLSQRNLVSVELYLADAKTGEVERKISDVGLDPHFSAIEFIASAGAWAPDSRRFAYPAVRQGAPALVIYDVERRGTAETLDFPRLGQIESPTWSPDGQRIAFSARAGGFTDLFVYDLRSRRITRLTDDAYADLQPAWSPDGRRLAFVSDRFTTHLPDLVAGDYQLVTLDLDTQRIDPVRGAAAGKNVSPQWIDAETLLFVSDRNGISETYRTSLGTNEARQVTNVPTGVTGITAISPAISYAPGSRTLVFTVYEDDRYNLYSLDSPELLAGRPVVSFASFNPAALPPVSRPRGELLALQQNPTIGLAAARQPRVTDYRPRLSLDALGQPFVGAGVDQFGAFAGGGLSLFFSDMLGNYNLGTSVQLNTGFGGAGDVANNIGAQVSFVNLKHRWNWGVAGGQMPWLAGTVATGLTDVNGATVGVQEQTVLRQLERSISGTAIYPFNRAQRLELTGGFTNISFDRRVQTTVFDPITGSVLADTTQDAPAPGSLNLGQAAAALVWDTSVFGATSPVAGQRYRLQVTPTLGSIRFNSVLADYRRYLDPAPFYTLAARVVHYGRYGRDSQDPRLVPLYLGYPNLVRGYDFNSLGPSDCTPNATSDCPQFDRLLGSRMLVANVEFRFPLLRPFTGVSSNMYGPVPLEVGFFYDAGVAWNTGEKPSFFGGDRGGVSSTGVALRANAFGFAILQFDFVRPLQRTRQGWMFQFSLAPGF